MSKHTPGEWHSVVDMATDRIEVTAPTRDGMAPIAQIEIGFTEAFDAEQEANARLISAAPEMLEALKGVVRVADRKTNEFDAARAVIKKAEARDG